MKRTRFWLLALMLLTTFLILFGGTHLWITSPILAQPDPFAVAQSPDLDSSPNAATGEAIENPNPSEDALTDPLPPPPSDLPSLPSPTLPNLPDLPLLPLSGFYRDAAGQFQLGILEGYQVSHIGNSPLIESADGTMSYTLVMVPYTAPVLSPLSDDEVARIAREVFQRGEGFQTQAAQPTIDGTVLNWTGTLTIGGQPQPVGGSILARQERLGVAVLLLATTESAAAQLPSAFVTLVDSLQFF